MKSIKEAEQITGITTQNIRYYEKQKLLTPKRNRGNSYREYSDEDINRLKMIRLFRSLDMPIGDIRRMFDGEVSLEDTIRLQMRRLENEREKLAAALDFCGTIKENIAYGKPGASMDEIIEAAKRANIHDFIQELPDGYDTYVGERGTRLSGGQKQRISIARVFLKNPPILILDEATSALDNESERWIQQSLEELSKDRTTITIAHRLSTIRNADEIIVITEDGIAERGTHESLLEKGGIYAHYYNM